MNNDLQSRVHFLNKNEFARVRGLFAEAFGEDAEFDRDFYGEHNESGEYTGLISRNEIAVLEADGHIVSSAQYMTVKAVPEDESRASYASYTVPYILGVCTAAEYRHRGYMDAVLKVILNRLKAEGYPWCFLAPVDTAIYRHLGFDTDWRLSMEERKLLYADDEGTELASAKLLNADRIDKVRIEAV